jgi:hypothetical protein
MGKGLQQLLKIAAIKPIARNSADDNKKRNAVEARRTHRADTLSPATMRDTKKLAISNVQTTVHPTL